jgi:hypothetical protein
MSSSTEVMAMGPEEEGMGQGTIAQIITAVGVVEGVGVEIITVMASQATVEIISEAIKT